MNRPDVDELKHTLATSSWPEFGGSTVDDLISWIDHLESQLAILREGLEWYANKDHYFTHFTTASCGCCSDEQEPHILDDQGFRARFALAKLNNGTQSGDVGAK